MCRKLKRKIRTHNKTLREIEDNFRNFFENPFILRLSKINKASFSGMRAESVIF